MTVTDANTETLTGILEHITYQSPEGGFLVGRLQPEPLQHPVTIRGTLFNVHEGQSLRLWGRWEEHPDYGLQFKVQDFMVVEPTSLEGMRRYLGSGVIPGIGPKTAERIVKIFGEETFDIIDQAPEKLLEVPKFPRKALEGLRESWAAHKALREVMTYLHSQGITSALSERIIQAYGFAAIEVIKENPYRLAMDVQGIGFRTADAIAQRMGLPQDAPQRAEAGLLHVMDELAVQGHTGYPQAQLMEQAGTMLDMALDTVQRAVDTLLGDGLLRRFEDVPEAPPFLLRPRYDKAEAAIAGHLGRIATGGVFSRIDDLEARLSAMEAAAGLYLAEEQREAVRAALAEKMLIVTGGPGTGKTTILQFILGLVEGTVPNVALAAPTGKAARRLTETTGREASTIHRLLEAGKGGFQRDATRPLDVELLIVDESSMIDTLLLAALLDAVPSHARLVLVGDVDQLPSVGPGMVLQDLIDCGALPVVRLERIFRQSARSRITENAHAIRLGQSPQFGKPEGDDLADFYFMREGVPERIVEKLLTMVTERIPERFGLNPRVDVQVLTPMHKGVTGAQNLNRVLQAALNPEGREIRAGGGDGAPRFRVGDRVMQIRNDYEKGVFNGDVGEVADWNEAGALVRVAFDDRDVTYGIRELEQLNLAYAITVHKAQGSEFPAVLIPVTTQHAIMLQRNLLYTAITRGRRLVVMLGTERAVAMAVNNARPVVRHTRLLQRLQQSLGAAAAETAPDGALPA